MSKMSLKEWIDYLKSRVDIDVYVYGGNGQIIVNLFPKLTSMEKSINDVDRVLTLLNKRLLRGIDIFEIRGEDCSGLAIKILLEKNIIAYDMTANGLYEYIVGTDKIPAHGKKISLKEVRAGDYLFQGSATNKHHVGYAVSEKYAVESKNHDEGVVETVIADRGWTYAARPNWYEDSPEPEKYVISRELYYTTPMMRGDDVEHVQERLNELNYNCGDVDGVFGKKTEFAVKNFQTDKGLTVDGIVGKHTVEALGFKWEG